MPEKAVDVLEKIIDKKLESYDAKNLDNFQASTELMVTITLNEYRKLIESKAELSNANRKVRQLEEKLEKIESVTHE